MLDYFRTARKAVQKAIQENLAEQGHLHSQVSADFGADSARRLDEFSSRGKMIRGCLVRLGYELGGGRTVPPGAEQAVARAGAAMELFQSGLLVHDDIMDRDRTRRGAPTLHVGYEADLARGLYGDPAHNGSSLGICAGDLAYFSAFSILSGLEVPGDVARQVCLTAARELALVGVAQMQDVANGAVRRGSTNPFRDAPASPDEETILLLYRYKTGRYTFSLPLSIGATLAESTPEVIASLEEAGEALGILFQLKDDELGLFADEDELGKPVGADIREDKKTLFRQRLFARADSELTGRLQEAFGNPSAGPAEVTLVREAIERLDVRSEIAAMMRSYAVKARGAVETLSASAPAPAKTAFMELVEYSLGRTS
ncbi:MAG: polyprenyl synthetase family protein [Clostridia bacterium]|jgi:geranylgeranyl diphosphate synthase type I